MFARSITQIINDCHLDDDSVFGEPSWIRKTGKPIVPVVDLSSAHQFVTYSDLDEHYKDPLTSVRYGRDSSSISLQLERYLSEIYKKPAFLFDSGMSAIAATLEMIAMRKKKIIVLGEIYRKSKEQLEYMLSVGSIDEVIYEEFENLESIKNTCPSIIFFEAFTNPHLHVADLDNILRLANSTGSLTIIDATLAGLDNAQTKIANFDFIIHSATKYINGFNDLTAGVCWCRNDFEIDLWKTRSRRGGLLDPWGCYLLLRGLRTYDIRSSAQKSNTLKMIPYLQNCISKNTLKRVYYPGFPANSSQAQIFNKNFDHGGSLVSFVPSVCQKDILQKINELRYIKVAPSFGSIDSLIELPAMMSHYGKSIAELNDISLEDNLVRLSIGCEPIEILFSEMDKILTP